MYFECAVAGDATGSCSGTIEVFGQKVCVGGKKAVVQATGNKLFVVAKDECRAPYVVRADGLCGCPEGQMPKLQENGGTVCTSICTFIAIGQTSTESHKMLCQYDTPLRGADFQYNCPRYEQKGKEMARCLAFCAKGQVSHEGQCRSSCPAGTGNDFGGNCTTASVKMGLLIGLGCAALALLILIAVWQCVSQRMKANRTKKIEQEDRRRVQ